MNITSVLHVGATGLVGRDVLARLLDDPRATRVVAPTRRPLSVAHPKLVNPVVDFDALPATADWWKVDAVICTLGTTMRQAGSREAFRRVDHAYPLQVARHAQAAGARVYALNSAAGADQRSRVFYSRVKGELERDLEAVGFESLVLVRPGLIGGERQEHRAGEAAASVVLRVLGPVLPRGWRINPATRVAAALVDATLAPQPGRQVVDAALLAG
ncbi:NAD-dependent epimerase/dehydratase family protein [Luteimonas sp. MHLX1A]|uniref:NAD-dependent epimerase/dehydratase family protein n=1 Tax=Alterluteimonas muca TaxID=2878684 RepID=UPI001E65D6A8|nr:NAD(P)H-binding protein [Luteimonas sp. MHLX1A]MCD9047539.1 NAD(P)H-binding protein [Luteimonas sp. MHLX1A]